MINGQLLYEGNDSVAALTHQKPGDSKADSTVLEIQDGRRAKTG
jgi:hypothetical protein